MPSLLRQPSAARQATDPSLLLQPTGAPYAEMSSYTPSWTERLGAGVQSAAEALGVNRPRAQRYGRDAETAAGFTPGLGQILSANDYARASEGGDWAGMGLAALGALPGGIGKEAKMATEGAGGLRSKLASMMAPGTEGIAAAEPLAHGRISQRIPTSPSATENPMKDNLLINLNVLRQDPEKLQQAADIIRSYPGFGSDAMKEMYPEEAITAARNQMTDNLLHLYDITPPDNRARSSQWYIGANRIANERAAETGVHPNAAAGVYAALSPQKNWHMNVNLGDKVLRTLAEDPRINADHLRLAETLYKPGEAALLRPLEGKRLSEMSPMEQALSIRLMDEVKGPGTRPFEIISPEGDYGQFSMTGKGERSQAAWQTAPNISKAVGAARSGGDPQLLSQLMGDRHKVRNFYNNITAPIEGRPFGDITADTHQIAASLFRPLGGSSPEVNVGLGGGAPSSNMTGMRGMYPIYADATRQAALLRNEPVHAMQSIPWEGIRSLFPDTFKTAKNQTKIDDIWRAYDRGEITADQARRHVVEGAGGFRPPTW
jgi:hypothetical protein